MRFIESGGPWFSNLGERCTGSEWSNLGKHNMIEPGFSQDKPFFTLWSTPRNPACPQQSFFDVGARNLTASSGTLRRPQATDLRAKFSILSSSDLGKNPSHPNPSQGPRLLKEHLYTFRFPLSLHFPWVTSRGPSSLSLQVSGLPLRYFTWDGPP